MLMPRLEASVVISAKTPSRLDGHTELGEVLGRNRSCGQGPSGPSRPARARRRAPPRSRVATRSRMVPRSPSNWSRACHDGRRVVRADVRPDAGCPAATRVMSLKPPAARRSSKRRLGPVARVHEGGSHQVGHVRDDRHHAVVVGRREGRPRRRRARPRTALQAAVGAWVGRGVGVSTQVAPTKRSASAPSIPICLGARPWGGHRRNVGR